MRQSLRTTARLPSLEKEASSEGRPLISCRSANKPPTKKLKRSSEVEECVTADQPYPPSLRSLPSCLFTQRKDAKLLGDVLTIVDFLQSSPHLWPEMEYVPPSAGEILSALDSGSEWISVIEPIVEALVKHLVSRQFYQDVVWEGLMLWEIPVRRETWLELWKAMLVCERQRVLPKSKHIKSFGKRRKEKRTTAGLESEENQSLDPPKPDNKSLTQLELAYPDSLHSLQPREQLDVLLEMINRVLESRAEEEEAYESEVAKTSLRLLGQDRHGRSYFFSPSESCIYIQSLGKWEWIKDDSGENELVFTPDPEEWFAIETAEAFSVACDVFARGSWSEKSLAKNMEEVRGAMKERHSTRKSTRHNPTRPYEENYILMKVKLAAQSLVERLKSQKLCSASLRTHTFFIQSRISKAQDFEEVKSLVKEIWENMRNQQNNHFRYWDVVSFSANQFERKLKEVSKASKLLLCVFLMEKRFLWKRSAVRTKEVIEEVQNPNLPQNVDPRIDEVLEHLKKSRFFKTLRKVPVDGGMDADELEARAPEMKWGRFVRTLEWTWKAWREYIEQFHPSKLELFLEWTAEFMADHPGLKKTLRESKTFQAYGTRSKASKKGVLSTTPVPDQSSLNEAEEGDDSDVKYPSPPKLRDRSGLLARGIEVQENQKPADEDSHKGRTKKDKNPSMEVSSRLKADLSSSPLMDSNSPSPVAGRKKARTRSPATLHKMEENKKPYENSPRVIEKREVNNEILFQEAEDSWCTF